VFLPCPLHVLLPRYPRFLGAGLHLSHLSHFRGPAQVYEPRQRCRGVSQAASRPAMDPARAHSSVREPMPATEVSGTPSNLSGSCRKTRTPNRPDRPVKHRSRLRDGPGFRPGHMRSRRRRAPRDCPAAACGVSRRRSRQGQAAFAKPPRCRSSARSGRRRSVHNNPGRHPQRG